MCLGHYQVIRALTPTAFGNILLCSSDMDACTSAASIHTDPPASQVVIKQISLHCARVLSAQLHNLPPTDQLQRQQADDPLQELRIVRILRHFGGHPNVVAHYNEHVVGSTVYLVLQHCADGDLHQFLQARRMSYLCERDAIAAVTQITAGLAFLHQCAIAHRDVSLENILLHEGVWKLAVHALPASPTASAVCTLSCRVGKPFYMAPEVVKAVGTYDPFAADMWSLGIVLFILLTGSPLVSIASEHDDSFKAFAHFGVQVVVSKWGMAQRMSSSTVQLIACFPPSSSLNPRMCLDQYEVVRVLTPTAFGNILLCSRNHARSSAKASSDPPNQLVIKQIFLRKARTFLDLQRVLPSSDQNELHQPDDPQQELRIGRVLRQAGGHPNVVAHYHEQVVRSTSYLFLQHCADGDLHRYLEARSAPFLCERDAIKALAQVAAGLTFLHGCGVAHRDVSLENILLHEGVWKIADFGLAVFAPPTAYAGCKLVCRVGKPFYMAPEVVKAVGTYDPFAADMWSLGIVLFILLTGSPLVSIASAQDDSFRAFLHFGVHSVVSKWGMAHRISDPTLQLVQDLLQLDPTKRPSSVHVLERLRSHECFLA
ncbi:TPA: hypothetical protein N0F65_010607 [Lagenidium giganteum]|uniref:Protein kinase domain-containing protein n=1 Tax=Lagenidium giganteum TaxID=4803 RepID=A0AAV2ZD79_9STRA|nr:TPA: hypothetical protein N0F65_010607 [Lagenidium giganteum]